MVRCQMNIPYYWPNLIEWLKKAIHWNTTCIRPGTPSLRRDVYRKNRLVHTGIAWLWKPGYDPQRSPYRQIVFLLIRSLFISKSVAPGNNGRILISVAITDSFVLYNRIFFYKKNKNMHPMCLRINRKKRCAVSYMETLFLLAAIGSSSIAIGAYMSYVE